MRIDVQHGDPGPFTLCDGAVSGVSVVLGMIAAKSVTILLVGSAGVTGGSVQLETSADPDFAGAWAPYGSPVTVVEGVTTVNIPVALLAFIRLQIVSPIVGGTLKATAGCGF